MTYFVLRLWRLDDTVRERTLGLRLSTKQSSFFFFLNHTAFKLNSLWHVDYLLDDFYGLLVCSRDGLLPYSCARRPDSTEPPQLSGLPPSYVPVLVPPRPSPYPSPTSSAISDSPTVRSNRSISHESS